MAKVDYLNYMEQLIVEEKMLMMFVVVVIVVVVDLKVLKLNIFIFFLKEEILKNLRNMLGNLFLLQMFVAIEADY